MKKIILICIFGMFLFSGSTPQQNYIHKHKEKVTIVRVWNDDGKIILIQEVL